MMPISDNFLTCHEQGLLMPLTDMPVPGNRVCIATPPGATNLVTGIATNMDSVPMVFFTGRWPRT